MRRVKEIQGSRPAGLEWAKTADLVDWGPFAIIGARACPTKFGDKVEFWLEHMETRERKGIMLSPTSVRQSYLDWFATPDAEPIGPVILMRGEKCWVFLDAEGDEAASEQEELPF